MNIVTTAEQIFEHGNLHMQNKLRFFGGQGIEVIKYIISKLRKYNGTFFESNSTIANACDCSVSTVQNAIKRAQQLEMFIVSSRTETTFEGKQRQTTNKIQLLVYEVVEVVKEVVEKVRTVAKKVVKKVVSSKPTPAPAKKKPFNKKAVRTELVPEWVQDNDKIEMLGESTVDVIVTKYKRYKKSIPSIAKSMQLSVATVEYYIQMGGGVRGV